MIKGLIVVVIILLLIGYHVLGDRVDAPPAKPPEKPFDEYAPHFRRRQLAPYMIEVCLPDGNYIGMVCFSPKLGTWAATWNTYPDWARQDYYIWSSQADAERELLRREREHTARLAERPALKR